MKKEEHTVPWRVFEEHFRASGLTQKQLYDIACERTIMKWKTTHKVPYKVFELLLVVINRKNPPEPLKL